MGLIIGILAIGLGVAAFTPKGIPVTKDKHLKGTPAAIVGVLCVLIGVVFILDFALASFSLFKMFSGK